MKVFEHSKKFYVLFLSLFFLVCPTLSNSIEKISSFPIPSQSMLGQFGQLLDDQHRRELDKEYRGRPYGWDRGNDEWRREQEEHKGWDRGKHKGWDRGNDEWGREQGEHRGWNRGKHKGWDKGKHKHKRWKRKHKDDWQKKEWGEGREFGKWGRK